jgi:hypothetical protein
LIGLAALILAAIFTGAAVYINLVEHPARMLLSPDQARAQWAPAYARGYAMQASLAVLSGVAGLIVWWRWNVTPQLIGSLLILANWPWTLLVIMPVNRRLQTVADTDPELPALLSRWARLHAIRSVLGFAATICFALPFVSF